MSLSQAWVERDVLSVIREVIDEHLMEGCVYGPLNRRPKQGLSGLISKKRPMSEVLRESVEHLISLEGAEGLGLLPEVVPALRERLERRDPLQAESIQDDVITTLMIIVLK